MEPIDVDFLTQKTFELSQQFGDLEPAPEPEEGGDFCQGPGVAFYLEIGPNTFCLRAVSTDDLEEVFDLIESGHPPVRQALRMEEGRSPAPRVMAFPTDSKASAEILVDHLANRRYPLREDFLCNLSDPGFSWWMDFNQNHLQIFFQSCSVDRAVDFVCLGPMGDPVIARRRLNQALPFLKNYFLIDEFSVTEKAIGLSVTTADCPNFGLFKEVFLSGEVELKKGIFPPDSQGKTLFLYFRELALKRRFWCQIEEVLARTLG